MGARGLLAEMAARARAVQVMAHTASAARLMSWGSRTLPQALPLQVDQALQVVKPGHLLANKAVAERPCSATAPDLSDGGRARARLHNMIVGPRARPDSPRWHECHKEFT